MKKIISNKYSIWIGKKSLSILDNLSHSKIAILVDENTRKLCLPILLRKCPFLKDSLIIEVRSGEENKDILTCNNIWKQLIRNNFDRDSLIINLGGGVIGDVGGFCASTFKRGIDFIHIPTTLLAMADAAIGGKLGINFGELKNTVGLFKNPITVLIYTDFVKTLEKDDLIFGLAEVVKHALIGDKNLWKYLINTKIKDLVLEDVINRSVIIKNNIILKDFKEKGERKKLNFGHTYGHAIESYYLQKQTPILHGQAIILGILLECKMSNLTNSQKNEISSYILSNFKLPYNPNKDQLIPFMINDKKNKKEKINFSLLEGIGDCSTDNLFRINEL